MPYKNIMLHKESIREANKYYRATHQKQRTEYMRLWRIAHLEQSKLYESQRYKAKLLHIKEQQQQWRRANPEKHAANNARRNALKYGNVVGKVDYKAIKQRDRMMCGICDKRVTMKDLSFDHIIPLICGGPHTEWNIQVAHRKCNSRKGIGRLPSRIRLEI